MLNFIQKIKDAIFWRDKYCEECGSYQSVSNNSPCYFCLKGDLAAQLFDNEDDYFEKLASRMNGDLPNVGKGDGLLNRQTLKDVSGVGTHNLRIVFLSF